MRSSSPKPVREMTQLRAGPIVSWSKMSQWIWTLDPKYDSYINMPDGGEQPSGVDYWRYWTPVLFSRLDAGIVVRIMWMEIWWQCWDLWTFINVIMVEFGRTPRYSGTACQLPAEMDITSFYCWWQNWSLC